MNRIIYDHRLLLLLYGSLVVVIGIFFIVQDERVLQETYHELPLLFLIRFSVFWFMCLMVAVAGFLHYLSHNQGTLQRPDKAYAAYLGRLALYIGMVSCSLAFLCFLTLYHYPFS